jgi:hypothetical protein
MNFSDNLGAIFLIALVLLAIVGFFKYKKKREAEKASYPAPVALPADDQSLWALVLNDGRHLLYQGALSRVRPEILSDAKSILDVDRRQWKRSQSIVTGSPASPVAIEEAMKYDYVDAEIQKPLPGGSVRPGETQVPR